MQNQHPHQLGGGNISYVKQGNFTSGPSQPETIVMNRRKNDQQNINISHQGSQPGHPDSTRNRKGESPKIAPKEIKQSSKYK